MSWQQVTTAYVHETLEYAQQKPSIMTILLMQYNCILRSFSGCAFSNIILSHTDASAQGYRLVLYVRALLLQYIRIRTRVQACPFCNNPSSAVQLHLHETTGLSSV
jgi:hypothetical protein